MALSIRLIHTWFRSALFPWYSSSSISINSSRFFFCHFDSSSRTDWRTSSDRSKDSISDRMLIFSILDRFSTLVESWDRRLDSLMMISRYSSRSSFVRLSFFSILAKPLRDTMGVLNSWEKLLMKSERSSSVFSSSWAMRLKLSERRSNSRFRSRWMRTLKLPSASWLMASIRSRMGLRGMRLKSRVRPAPTTALSTASRGMGRQNWGMGISAW